MADRVFRIMTRINKWLIGLTPVLVSSCLLHLNVDVVDRLASMMFTEGCNASPPI